MKGRSKQLLALFLSASMAVTPMMSAVPVLADETSVVESVVSSETVETEGAQEEQQEQQPVEEQTEEQSEEISQVSESTEEKTELTETEEVTAETPEETQEKTPAVQTTDETGTDGIAVLDAEVKSYSIKVNVINSSGVVSGMYAMDNAVATKQDDGTYLVRMHQTSVNRNYMALTNDKAAATAHKVDWYIAGGDDGYWYTIPVKSLSDTIYACFSYTKNVEAGKDFSKVQTITFDTSSMTETTERDAVISDMNISPAVSEETELTVSNMTGMFRVTKAVLKKDADGKDVIVITLGSTGYEYLFKGTYEDAVANGDNRANWIKYETDESGAYQFTIPLNDGETTLELVSISANKLANVDEGTGKLEQAFYPRQAVIDYTAKTLVAGDYNQTKDLAVTNNVKMFNVASAGLNTIGGPNSNNYEEILKLTMGTDSFDKVYVGTKADAEAATNTIAITGRKADISVKKNAVGGSVIYDYLEKATTISFHSTKNDTWYERSFTVSKTGASLVIDTVQVPATKVTVSETAKTVYVGDSFELTATVEPSDSTDQVTWTSDNEKIATVDASGKVTGVATGTATITATVGNFKAECEVTVKANTFTYKIQPMIWKGSGSATKEATDVKVTATDAEGNVIEAVEDASKFMVFDKLDVHKTYTVKVSREGYNVVEKTGTSYQPINETVYTKEITAADDGKTENVTFQLDELTAILKDVPTDASLYEEATFAALKAAVDSADTNEKEVAKRNVAADTIRAAIAALKLREDGEYLAEATVSTGLGMCNLILLVENGEIKAQFIGSVKAYGKIYMGSNTDAKKAADTDPNMILPGNDGNTLINSNGVEGYQFTIPVSGLGQPITFSSYATARTKWQQQTVTFSALSVKKCGIALDKTEATMEIGQTLDLTATAVAEDPTVSWTSSDETVATVADGKVTAVGHGETVITAKAGKYVAECKISVHTLVTIPAVAATCTSTGLTEGKKCSVCGEIFVEQKVTDKLAHTEEIIPAVAATCTSTGLTEGKKCAVCGEILVAQKTVEKLAHKLVTDKAVPATPGHTGLTEGQHCSVCGTVTVKQEITPALPTEINVSKISVKSTISTKIAAGKKVQLTATVTPKNAANKKVTWVSSNKKVATVSATGLVTMNKKAGGKTVVIKAISKENGRIVGSIKLTCMKGYVRKVSISGKRTVKAGKTLKLKARVYSRNGKANKSVKWSSSNPKLATVSNGKVKTFKGKKGTVKITVRSLDGTNKSKTVKIRIK